VGLAAVSDAAVVVVGTTAELESEGGDRTGLALPGGQNALVEAVAAVNPRTVVVVNSGAPVALPWRERVPALLLCWFPGQEAGHGLADVLLGRAEPAGRLPTTWGDEPRTAVLPRDGRLEYREGLHLGYRGWLRDGVRPAYWFGHGLGYTSWTYEELVVPAVLPAGEDCAVRVTVRNSGRRAGREVVQVYLSRPDSVVERPVRWLAGYAAARAEPGERVRALIRIPARVFQHWSPEDGAWRSEPGRYTVAVGRSVGELPLRSEVSLEVAEPPDAVTPPGDTAG
jgi:beta-glucosidase